MFLPSLPEEPKKLRLSIHDRLAFFSVGSISPRSTKDKTASVRQFLLEPVGRGSHCLVYHRGHLKVQPLHPERFTDCVYVEHCVLLYKDPGNFVR